MSHCIWCDQPLIPQVSWSFILGLQPEGVVCAICLEQLKQITGEICQICGRPLSLFPEKYQQNGRCHDCIRWENDENWSGMLTKNRSLYQYNDFLQELLAKYKFRGDALIANGFGRPIRTLYEQHFKGTRIVPIPLSPGRHYERGFNQSVLIAEQLEQPIHEVLNRIQGEEKQSKKNRKERVAMNETIFTINEEHVATIKEQNILLIDDIYTTGATLRQAAKVLIDHGAATVQSLTIARS